MAWSTTLGGEFSEAAALLEPSIRLTEGSLLYERFGGTAIQSVFSRGYLVDVLSQLGRFDEAIAHAEMAVRITEEVEHRFSLCFGLLDLGLAHLRRGDIPRTTLVLERCLTRCRTWQVAVLLPFTAAPLAVAYTAAERIGEALPLIQGAVEGFRGRALHCRPGLILKSAGVTYLQAGRIGEATGFGREALALTRRLGARGAEAHALTLSGDIAVGAGAEEEGEGHYREARALAEPRGMRPLVAHCHLGLGKFYRRTAKREQARERLATATTMYQEIASDRRGGRAIEVPARVDFSRRLKRPSVTILPVNGFSAVPSDRSGLSEVTITGDLEDFLRTHRPPGRPDVTTVPPRSNRRHLDHLVARQARQHRR